MSKYTISYLQNSDDIIQITYVLENVTEPELKIQLPAWRPGRYELGNFGQNMFTLSATNQEGEELHCHKIKKDLWSVKTLGSEQVTFVYQYAAVIKNAGGTFKSKTELVITPVNCLVYAESRINEPCELIMDVPKNFKVVSSLMPSFQAANYYELGASPIVAGLHIQTRTIQVHGVNFHVCFQGSVSPNWERVLGDFKKFIVYQLAVFGDFPSSDYYFLNLIFDEKHYHGVEHLNSTLIALGPDSEFNDAAFYQNFLGISSHELFHYWNICRIRPVEMLPYDYRQENYFETGYIAEGITTYYGDYALGKSGALTTEQCLQELSGIMTRHLLNAGRTRVSVAESSIDLWLDGYKAGVTGRKVSIYAKGATIAFILDLWIRKTTNNLKSLDDVMRLMWQNHGAVAVGYTSEDYQKYIEQVVGQSVDWYFRDLVHGTVKVEKYLEPLLEDFGMVLELMPTTVKEAQIPQNRYVLKKLKEASEQQAARFKAWMN